MPTDSISTTVEKERLARLNTARRGRRVFSTGFVGSLPGEAGAINERFARPSAARERLAEHNTASPESYLLPSSTDTESARRAPRFTRERGEREGGGPRARGARNSSAQKEKGGEGKADEKDTADKKTGANTPLGPDQKEIPWGGALLFASFLVPIDIIETILNLFLVGRLINPFIDIVAWTAVCLWMLINGRSLFSPTNPQWKKFLAFFGLDMISGFGISIYVVVFTFTENARVKLARKLAEGGAAGKLIAKAVS